MNVLKIFTFNSFRNIYCDIANPTMLDTSEAYAAPITPYSLIKTIFSKRFVLAVTTTIENVRLVLPIESRIVPYCLPKGINKQYNSVTLSIGTESAYFPPA